MHGMTRLWLLPLLAAAAHAQINLTNDVILEDLFWKNPTSTRIDDHGAVHIAYMRQLDTDSNSKEIWYATNASGAWTHTQVTNNAVREEFPNLELDAAGNVHIAFHTGLNTSNQIRYVNNVGGAFNPIVDITGQGYIIVEHAVDSTGTVHFAFYSQETTADIFYRSWSPTTGLGALVNVTSTPSTNETEPYLTVGPDDAIHLVYHVGSVFAGGPLVYRTSSDGITFTPVPTGVSGNVLVPIPLVRPDGQVSIIYERSNVLYMVTDDGAGNFGGEVTLFSGGNPAFIEGVTVDFAGRRHIPFVSNSGTTGVYLVTESNNGLSTPLPIDLTSQTRQGASVAVNRWGRLAFTWQLSGFDSDADVVFADMYIATAPTIGDLNLDGVVDLADVGLFDGCSAGPDMPSLCGSDATAQADAEWDGDVDLADFSRMQGAPNGA